MRGVYILLKGTEPIYIGRSKNIEKRLIGHRHKDYDHYVVIPAKEFRLNWLESMLISVINPQLNKVQNWFCFQVMDENIDYLKNFTSRRRNTLVLYPSGSDRYYLRNRRSNF